MSKIPPQRICALFHVFKLFNSNHLLKLEIKSNYQIFRVEDRSISFVGYKIYHDYTLIRKNIKHKMCKKVAAMNKLKHMTYSEYR